MLDGPSGSTPPTIEEQYFDLLYHAEEDDKALLFLVLDKEAIEYNKKTEAALSGVEGLEDRFVWFSVENDSMWNTEQTVKEYWEFEDRTILFVVEPSTKNVFEVKTMEDLK